jgi:hypothetical protein
MKKIHLLVSIAVCVVAVLSAAAQPGREGSILNKDFTAPFGFLRDLGAVVGLILIVGAVALA